jgi:hypothetical protein
MNLIWGLAIEVEFVVLVTKSASVLVFSACIPCSLLMRGLPVTACEQKGAI